MSGPTCCPEISDSQDFHWRESKKEKGIGCCELPLGFSDVLSVEGSSQNHAGFIPESRKNNTPPGKDKPAERRILCWGQKIRFFAQHVFRMH